MTRITKYVAILPLLIFMGVAAMPASAQVLPGNHPAYPHVLTDLRTARWLLNHHQMSRIESGQASKRNASIEAKGSTKNLPGGGAEFYIPNLTTDDVMLVGVESLA